MLRKRYLTFILLFLLCVTCLAQDYVPDQIIVKFRQDVIEIKGAPGNYPIEKLDVKSQTVKSLNAKYKAERFSSFASKGKKFKKIRSGRTVELPDLSGVCLIEFQRGTDVMAAVEEYRRDPYVELAEPNYIRKAFTEDPYYQESVAMPQNQWGLFKIWLGPTGEARSGWDVTTGTMEVKVAVLDSGIRYTHEDLVSRVDTYEGFNYFSTIEAPTDSFGHGTHVAGIIGAATNNNKGIAGVDWNCRLLPVKVLNNSGEGDDYAISAGIYWAVSKEADVINMSLGGRGTSSILEQAVSFASTSDCIIVAAAGNDDSTVLNYPAAYPEVISVAATDRHDYKASYSNYGTWIKVSAPGGDDETLIKSPHEILSTYKDNNSDYTYLEGTSMAAPFVSGLAALIRAKYPTMEADDVMKRITDYSDNIDAYNLSYKGRLGKGRVNALAALGGLYAYIGSPMHEGTGYGIVHIFGSATGEGFDSFTVEYGFGRNPTQWTTIETSFTPVLNTLIATLDTTGMDAWLTLKLAVNSIEATADRLTFHAGSKEDPIVMGRVQYGPNPFNPRKEQILIKYDLSANSDTYIYIYDISGTVICTKYCPWGGIGGMQGTNRVYWDGQDSSGNIVANGVYLLAVASQGRTIGKGKIIVLK